MEEERIVTCALQCQATTTTNEEMGVALEQEENHEAQMCRNDKHPNS